MARYKSGGAVQAALRQREYQEKALDKGDFGKALDPKGISRSTFTKTPAAELPVKK